MMRSVVLSMSSSWGENSTIGDATAAESLLTKPFNCTMGEANTGLDRSSRIESLVRKW
jgi:hypothetical protein